MAASDVGDAEDGALFVLRVKAGPAEGDHGRKSPMEKGGYSKELDDDIPF